MTGDSPATAMHAPLQRPGADAGTAAGSNDGPVAVIGAGIIGAVTALHLRRLGRDVVLIDRAEP